MKNIIQFYTKAKANEQLGGFYELCSWIEIDEYSDYEKALSALNHALKLYNSTESREKSNNVIQRIKYVSKFNDARKLEQSDQNKMIEICKQLIDEPDIGNYIRIGDVFGQLIE